MGFNVTPEQVQAFEAARKARQAENERIYNEAQQQRQVLNATIKAKVDATRLNEIHTAQQDYTCDNCGKPIQKGTQYRRSKIIVGNGWPEGVHYTQVVKHLVCVVEHYCPQFEVCGNTQSAMCTNKACRESFKECGTYKQKTGAQA